MKKHIEKTLRELKYLMPTFSFHAAINGIIECTYYPCDNYFYNSLELKIEEDLKSFIIINETKKTFKVDCLSDEDPEEAFGRAIKKEILDTLKEDLLKAKIHLEILSNKIQDSENSISDEDCFILIQDVRISDNEKTIEDFLNSISKNLSNYEIALKVYRDKLKPIIVEHTNTRTIEKILKSFIDHKTVNREVKALAVKESLGEFYLFDLNTFYNLIVGAGIQDFRFPNAYAKTSTYRSYNNILEIDQLEVPWDFSEPLSGFFPNLKKLEKIEFGSINSYTDNAENNFDFIKGLICNELNFFVDDDIKGDSPGASKKELVQFCKLLYYCEENNIKVVMKNFPNWLTSEISKIKERM